jgi:hypothetical protein
MLLCEDDLQVRRQTTAIFLQAQALHGLGRRAQADRLLGLVRKRDPNYEAAADFANL